MISQDIGQGQSVDRRIERRLFFCFLLVYLAFSGGHLYTADDWSRYYSARGFMLHLRPAVPDLPHVYGVPGRDDLRVSHFPPGLSMAGLPLLAAGHLVGSYFPERCELLERMSLSLLNQLLMPLLLVLLFRLLQRTTLTTCRSTWITIAAGFGSLAFPYSKHFWAEPLQTVLILAALLQVGSLRERHLESRSYFLFSASLAGAFLTKYETIIPAGVLVATVAARYRPKTWGSLLWFSAPWVVAALISGSYNLWRFGSALDFGYGGLMLSSSSAPASQVAEASMIPGIGVWLRRLYLLLASPGKGLFIYTPLTVLAVVGSVSRRGDLITRLGYLCGYALLFFYIVLDRSSTWCWGPRYLFPTMILLWPGVAQFDGRALIRALFLVLAALGVIAAMLGVLVNFHDAIEEIRTSEGFEGWEWVHHVHSDPRLSPLVWHGRLIGSYFRSTIEAGLKGPRHGIPPVRIRHRRIDVVWLSLWAGGGSWLILLVPVILLFTAWRAIGPMLRER